MKKKEVMLGYVKYVSEPSENGCKGCFFFEKDYDCTDFFTIKNACFDNDNKDFIWKKEVSLVDEFEKHFPRLKSEKNENGSYKNNETETCFKVFKRTLKLKDDTLIYV